MTLNEITPFIEKGLPFKRTDWENDFYLYYDTKESVFFRHVYRSEHNDAYDIKEYTLGLDLDDLLATDWVSFAWGEVK